MLEESDSITLTIVCCQITSQHVFFASFDESTRVVSSKRVSKRVGVHYYTSTALRAHRGSTLLLVYSYRIHG